MITEYVEVAVFNDNPLLKVGKIVPDYIRFLNEIRDSLETNTPFLPGDHRFVEIRPNHSTWDQSEENVEILL